MLPGGKVVNSIDKLSDSQKPFELKDACDEWYKLARAELAKFKNYHGDIPFPGWEAKPSDYVDKSNDRKFICLVKRDKVNGRQYEVQLDRRNHIATFIVHGNAHDREAGLVGTDNRVVVKMLNQNSYDFVKSDDFIDRINMIFSAAKSLAEAEKDNLTIEDFNALNLALEKSRLFFLQTIRDHCDFHTADHAIRNSKDADSSANTQAAHKTFNDAHEIAEKAISASIDKCARLLESFRSTYYSAKYQKEPDKDKIVEELKHKEVELIAARGRHLDIKISDGPDGDKNMKMVSAQMPLGAKTLPSTHRTGDDPDTKLSNHVRDFSGVVYENGKILKRLEVDNHSSYCPIQQKDGPLRVWGSYLAAREKVMQLAMAQLAADPALAGNGIGIDVNLTTLTLLSPYKSEKANTILQGKNSEYMQLKDIRTALNILMYGPPLELAIGDKKMPVRLHSTHMNLPVNAAGLKVAKVNITGVKYRAVNPEIQKHINAKGFFDFKEKLTEQMHELLNMKEVMNTSGQQLVDNLELYFENQSPRVAEKYIAATNTIFHSQVELNDVHKQWFSVLSEYQQDQALANPTGYPSKANILTVKKYAESINTRLGIAYLDIEKEFENNFNKLAKNTNIELVNMLHQYLRNHNDVMLEPVREKLVCLLRGLQAERLYHERFKNRDEQAYDFHVNYLLANYSFGQLVEFFCKSAEDRTGALRIKLFANMMFDEIHHRPPNLNDAADAAMLSKYLKFAHEVTVSLENTKHNSEARGLQVKEIFTINGYNMDAGKLMAGLAKGPYDKDLVTQQELMAFIDGKEAEKSKKPSVLGFLGSRTRKDRAASKESASANVSPTASQRSSDVESPPKETAGLLQRNRSGRLQLPDSTDESPRGKPISPGRKG